jgi:hypothetical protein
MGNRFIVRTLKSLIANGRERLIRSFPHFRFDRLKVEYSFASLSYGDGLVAGAIRAGSNLHHNRRTYLMQPRWRPYLRAGVYLRLRPLPAYREGVRRRTPLNPRPQLLRSGTRSELCVSLSSSFFFALLCGQVPRRFPFRGPPTGWPVNISFSSRLIPDLCGRSQPGRQSHGECSSGPINFAPAVCRHRFVAATTAP